MSFGPTVLAPGEGLGIWQLGNEFTLKASAEHTNGAYTLLEQTCAGAPAPMHIHDDEEEAFYVLEGSLDLHVGDQLLTAEPGSFCLIPRGTAHSFRSTGAEAARLLVLLSPPGFERFFARCEERFPRTTGIPDPEVVGPALQELARDHALRIVGPPPS